MELYNLNGQRVRKMFYGNLAPGRHRVPAFLGDLPSGTYILEWKSRSYRETFQVIKM